MASVRHGSVSLQLLIDPFSIDPMAIWVGKMELLPHPLVIPTYLLLRRSLSLTFDRHRVVLDFHLELVVVAADRYHVVVVDSRSAKRYDEFDSMSTLE